MMGEGTGYRVEATALPVMLTGIFGKSGCDGFDPGPGNRLQQILGRRGGWTPIRVRRPCTGATTENRNRTKSPIGGDP